LAVEVAQSDLALLNKMQTKQGNFSFKTEKDRALLHELQLGEQLNQSVQDTRRADFSLLLAMLAGDVREQSQFLLPQEKETPKQELSNSALRRKFDLPEKSPLALTKIEDVRQFNQAQYVTGNKLTELRLFNVLQPKPLSFRDDKQFINSQVVENTSLLMQLKLQQLSFNKQQMQKKAQQLIGLNCTDSTLDGDNVHNQTLNTRQAVNVNAWLDTVQKSIAKASSVI
jgi:hypothetical protein